MQLNRRGDAARSPPSGGRQGSSRATRKPRNARPHSALAQPPGFVTLAGDTEALFSVDFSRPADPTSYGRLAGQAAAPSGRHSVQITAGGMATTDAHA
jgi:hypothetical protein